MKLCLILPAFNEEKVIGGVLEKVKKELRKHKNFKAEIVIVNDGSWDRTGKIAEEKRVTLLSHVINRGLGAALKTGLEYARRQKADLAVTMDTDGQHDPQDLFKLIKPIINKKADVVIGVRQRSQMPWDRNLITFFSSIITYFLFGVYSSDTQSGFRAFNRKALEKIEIKTQRMEVSSEFFGEIKQHKLKLVEVPIKVIYTAYSRAKGQSNLNSVKVLIKLILRLGR